MTTYDQGYFDFAGMNDVNPYPVGTEEYLEWSEGHSEAMTDFYDREQVVL